MLLQSSMRAGVAATLLPLIAMLAANAQEPGQLATVVVTGTRLQQTDAASTNPVTVLTADDMSTTAAATVEQVLRKLPSIDFTGSYTSDDATAGNGASNAGLRNLGPQRTLILVNGYRYPFTDVAGSAYDAVDLGNIDVATIDRIEILRDGASSIYGADAIGGVINVITKQHFDGVELGGGAGISSHGDAFQQGAHLLLGHDFDRGNILFSAGESHQDGLDAADRAWAIDEHPDAGYNSYANTSTRVNGALVRVGGKSFYFGNDGAAGGILASKAASLGSPIDSEGIAYGGGGLAPDDIALRGGVASNFLGEEGLTVGYEKRQASVDLHYELQPELTAIVEAFYTDRNSNELQAPSSVGNTPTPDFPLLYIAGLLPNGMPNPYNPTNPANPAYAIVNPKASAALTNINVPILTRANEDGSRILTQDTQTFRIRAGLEGSLWGRYHWEAGYYYAESQGRFSVTNQVDFEHIAQELGMLPCGSSVGCSVGDFLGYDQLTPSQASYLTFTSIETSVYRQESAYGNVSGSLYDLPAGALAGALGVEYRQDRLSDTPSPIVSSGDAAVVDLPTSGSYGTVSSYLEFNIPLLKDLPLLSALTANISGRYDDNDKFGNAVTYKAALDYRMTQDLRFRASRATGFRAPQLRELYGGPALLNVKGADPCEKGGSYANGSQCLESLRLAGATTADVPISSELNDVVEGGNPALKPESSTQWLFGGVFTPRAVAGLSVSADYYSIKVANEISAYDPNLLLSACYGGVRYLVSQAVACQLTGFASRTPGTGSLGLISALNGNVGVEATSGVDMVVTYGADTAALGLPWSGHLDFNGSAAYLLKDDISANGTTLEQAGTFSGADAEPRWKALAGLQYARGPWSLGWSTRYYGGVRNQNPASACEYGTVVCPPGDVFNFVGNEAPGVLYHDIEGAYRSQRIFVTVGIDNLFDKSPPFVFPGSPGTTLGSAGYDFVGRFVYLKTTVKL